MVDCFRAAAEEVGIKEARVDDHLHLRRPRAVHQRERDGRELLWAALGACSANQKGALTNSLPYRVQATRTYPYLSI